MNAWDVLVRADARALPLAAGCIQCVVTSPPYWGLRDYGVDGQLGLEPTPDAYVANMVAVFRQVHRVLRDDGVLFLNLGDSYAGGQTLGRNDAGRNFTGGGGNRIGSGNPGRQGAHDRESGLKPKDLVGVPWRVAFALQADGWWLRSDIIWAKRNCMPEPVTDRPTKSHEYVFLLAKSGRYFYDAEAIGEPLAASTLRLKRRILRGQTAPARARPNGPTRNVRSVWTIATQPYDGAHFATMPEALAERCILAGSRPGDLVLDPFVGSGTVARCAISLGRRAVGCDLNQAYLRLADERTQVTRGLPLERAAAAGAAMIDRARRLWADDKEGSDGDAADPG